jgi:hypothetical protein
MKPYSSKYLFAIFLASAIVLGGFSICPAVETTVEKIINNRDSYDGREVSVTGTVSNLKFKRFETGNDYTTFMLASKSGGRIKVFIWGKSKLQAGQKVQVTGVFRKVRTTARRQYHNEIEASEVK